MRRRDFMVLVGATSWPLAAGPDRACRGSQIRPGFMKSPWRQQQPLAMEIARCPVSRKAPGRGGRSQQRANIPRIGFLGNSSAALETNLVGPFREGLRDLGYVEEQNIVIEYRWAEGNYERFPSLIAELLGQNVVVIVTAGTPASLAVKKAMNSVPLVMVGVGDPVATGLVASLAKPGGNVTGLTSTAEETEGKRCELNCSRS
jgi:hypothetical protein